MEKLEGMKAIAVLDHSVSRLFIYDVNEHLTSDEIEEFINDNGHHNSNCSWGEFDGQITDLRND